MAPKRRPAKPRLTRMDAAIDAMNQFGFSKNLVRGTVKGLLKEYGGDEGWAFIEGDAYKLLIETILDEQEKHEEDERELEEGRQDQHEEKGKNLLKNSLSGKHFEDVAFLSNIGSKLKLPSSLEDSQPVTSIRAFSVKQANVLDLYEDSLQEGRVKDNAVATGAGPSGEVLAHACSEDSLREGRFRDKVVATVARPSGGVLAPACSEHTASENILAEVREHTSLSGGDGEGWKKIGLNQNYSRNVMANIGSMDKNSVARTSLDSSHSTASSVVSPLSTFSNLPTRRRKPCYGWISDDDEDEEDFIELNPDIQLAKTAMLAHTRTGGSDGTDKKAKRKIW